MQMIWQIPDTQHELLWDYGMCADTSQGAAVRELISRACKGALAPSQHEVPFAFIVPLLFPYFGSYCQVVLLGTFLLKVETVLERTL